MQYAPGTGIMSAQAPMGPMMGSYPPPMGFAHPPPFAFPMHHPMNHQVSCHIVNNVFTHLTLFYSSSVWRI